MRKLLSFILLAAITVPAGAQRILTLDSCRAMALRNNKQLSAAKLKQEVAFNTQRATRTKYLPKVDVLGGYEWTSKEVSLLKDSQKEQINNLGTTLAPKVGEGASSILTNMAQNGLISPQQAQALGAFLSEQMAPLAQAVNGLGQGITDAFRTDTRNIFAAAVMVKQPIYMGGAITAANRMADINMQLTANSTEAMEQNTLYGIDQAYWTIVSLRQKQKLADAFLQLVQKLDGDVNKMIEEGVATKADGLKVSVKVNEAEMAVTQVENGLSLAKMLLCQLCGLPVDENITLADEENTQLSAQPASAEFNMQTAMDNRPELKALENAVDISKQMTKLTRAAYMPQVALTGGYMVMNPNPFNGFEKEFSGVFNVGVLVRVPVWNWFEGAYKVRASRTATSMAKLELDDAREKIELQVNQSAFKVKEANKRLTMALKNVEKAEENLRCANLGFQEGVMQSTEVMEAQTAWLQANTQRIEAEIDVKLSEVQLQKALGTMRIKN
ncbi:MAG: TolC family protein [Prevotella sp.]|nr:TolC family protein [Prevotella sp.]